MAPSMKSIGDPCGSRSVYFVERRYMIDGQWTHCTVFNGVTRERCFYDRRRAYVAMEDAYRECKEASPKTARRADFRVRLYARVEE